MKLLGNKVTVDDGNFEKAMRKFKKKVSDSGVLQRLQEKQFYVKPTSKRKIAKGQAIRRWQKYLRDQTLPKKEF